ncbi:MAG: hypothetical protein WCC12_10305 [Anaerolineales bacterium]
MIPTIDPAAVSDALRYAFSVLTQPGVNGHQIRQITGWDYGFGGGYWYGACSGYEWLDTDHMLLYPAAGQVDPPEGRVIGINVVPQPVVVNLESGSVWLPRAHESTSPYNCNRVYWSRELGMLITTEEAGAQFSGNTGPIVVTYTFDGERLSHYWGELLDIAPGGTKILVGDDTLIDLRNDKIIDLAWYMNYDLERSSQIYWSLDGNRLYRCCYYFADLSTGKSYNFDLSDLRRDNGSPGPSSMLPHEHGEWVRNDTYFLVEWSWVDDGDIGYLPLFNPAENKYYDVYEMAGIAGDWHSYENTISSDGRYVWSAGWGDDIGEGGYLINLFTFEARFYPTDGYGDVDWSADGTFAWLQSSGSGNDTARYHLLSVSETELKDLPVDPSSMSNFTWQDLWWHPADDVLAYLSEDGQKLELLNAQTMSDQELALPTIFQYLAWSPMGKRIALLAKDSSLWQVDYPKLENLEQLTEPMPDVRDVFWSPDSSSLAFVGGSDIYIVDTMK